MMSRPFNRRKQEVPIRQKRVDSGDVEEPARLEPSAEYYSGGQQVSPQGNQANLFYNFYATPGNPAAMYPAPFPTPANVGHVYYTYQPFLPHEFLYPHFRDYYTYHGNHHGYEHLQGGGTYTRTTVRWARGHAPRAWFPARPHGPAYLPSIPTQRYPHH